MGALVVVLVVLVIAGVAVLSYLTNKKRREALIRFAAAQGWRYEAEDDSILGYFSGDPFGTGFSPRARNVMTGQHGGHPVTAFDYSYKTRTTDSNGRSREQTHYYAVYAVGLPVPLPRLRVVPESVLSRMGRVLGMGDIELESEDFNRRFRVTSDDAKFAYDVLSARTMEAMLSQPDQHWHIAGTSLVCWDSGRLRLERITARLAMARAVVEGIPSFVWRDRGVAL